MMNGLPRFVSIALVLAQFGVADPLPKALWGHWMIRRVLPTQTISCLGDADAQALIGTDLEYSANLFRWNGTVTKNATSMTSTITAQQFHDENSGVGANSSHVTLQQLGIKANKAVQTVIHHPPSNVTRGTIEIPGDRVLLKDVNTIVISICNVYFEAARTLARD